MLKLWRLRSYSSSTVWFACLPLCNDWCQWSRQCSLVLRRGQLIFSMMSSGFFFGPAHRCRAGGRVHRPSTKRVARRRRERRLRSWLRHEQQSVRMALVAASHHSAQQNDAQTGARAREVEEQVTHVGLRAQKTPPPGILSEPGPQRSDRSGRHFSGRPAAARHAVSVGCGRRPWTLQPWRRSTWTARRERRRRRWPSWRGSQRHWYVLGWFYW